MSRKIQEFSGLAEKFRAIGHPARVAILNLLCTRSDKRLTVKSIYETLGLDQPGASRHLNIMRKSGILERVQEGGDTFYCLSENEPHVNCIKKCF
ncbi:MAG: metalloregulator ArsR/SmtB family transcription factor [Cyclobacteriaceae bacterium]|nr:metalloregulator ArsR/SmtB family transcription factor [Cyclobacteriaceae bacterium]